MRAVDREFVIANTDFWGHGGTYWHNQNVIETYGFTQVAMPRKPIRYAFGYNHPDAVDEFLTRERDDAGVYYPPVVSVIHWIGSDVLQAQESRRIPPPGIWHFCDSFDLQAELLELGVEAQVVIHRPRHRVEAPLPLPKKPTLAIYMPPHRRDFFRYDLMCDVERVVKAWGWDVAWLDMSEAELNAGGRDVPALLANSSHYLRCPIHDGFSHTAAEFVMAGRVVLTTAERPFQIRVQPKLTDICNHLNSTPFVFAPAFYRWLTDRDRLYEALWQCWLDSQS